MYAAFSGSTIQVCSMVGISFIYSKVCCSIVMNGTSASPHVHMWFSKLAQVAYARARFDEAHTDELMAAIDRQFADASKPVIASWDLYVCTVQMFV